MTTTRFLEGIRHVADGYEALIIDQWGVLHNGTAPLPDVHETLAELQRRNKRLVLLSNSGKRARFNREQLRAMGFNVGMFEGIVTSGEAAWSCLKDRTLPPFDQLGKRVFLITRDDDREIVEDLELEIMPTVADADFIVLAGTDPPPATLDDYLPILHQAVPRHLPLICCNPDIVAATIDGNTMAPGMIAEKYRELGGKATYVGKPNRPIYDVCFSILEDFKPSEILAIGDSLAHDIRGAKDAGMDAAFVLGGIHAHELDGLGAADQETRIKELSLAHRGLPDYVIPRLVW